MVKSYVAEADKQVEKFGAVVRNIIMSTSEENIIMASANNNDGTSEQFIKSIVSYADDLPYNIGTSTSTKMTLGFIDFSTNKMYEGSNIVTNRVYEPNATISTPSSVYDYPIVNVDINGKTENYYKIVSSFDTTYIFQTFGNLDTYLTLYDSKYNRIDYNDDGGYEYNAKLSIYLTKNSTYYISVRGYSSNVIGQTKLCMSGVQSTIQENNSTSVSLKGQVWQIYEFRPTETDTYIFETNGNYDTYMYLYDSNMNQITYNDDGGNGLNSRIQYNLVNGNTYYIGLRAYGSSTTGYTQLTCSKPSELLSSSESLSLGTSTVKNNSRYTFTAQSDGIYVIETTDDIDTMFNSIISDASDYDYYDDTYIDDNDGGETFYDASLYVYLRAGESISFTVTTLYSNPSNVHFNVYTL